MINYKHLQTDMKQIKEEPIMLLFVLLSLVLVLVFKGIVEIGGPSLKAYTGFDLLEYHIYIVSMVYMLQPLMLGTVMGFFMLDEKDAKIFELLRVTPLGISGYMVNRLLLPVILNLIYMVIGYLLLGHLVHEAIALLPISLFLTMETIGIGLFIAMVSEDKVKGLTYAKAVGVLIVFGFVDVIPIPAMKLIGRFVPQYYVTAMVQEWWHWDALIGLVIHGIWLWLIYRRAIRRL